MALFELFSKRRKRERGDFPDVYTYEEIPNELRVQIVHLIEEGYASEGSYFTDEARKTLDALHSALCREYGKFHLAGEYDRDFEAIANFVLNEPDHEKVLDVVELTFRYADNAIRKNNYYYNSNLNVDKYIEELNQRFKEAGIGYQFESGEIIRVDSQYLHNEAVKPALKVLRHKVFKSANQEFLTAHEHYRHGRYEESVTECLKAIESLLKTICTNKSWPYDPKDTAKKLINIVLQNGLIPSFMQNQLNVLQTLLESGVPTVRNKLAGHGQGPSPRQMPSYFASYVLHLTASTILLLANAAQIK